METDAKKPLAGYLGPAGTFSEDAAARHFGGAARFAALPTIEAVFEAVANGEIDYGVAPIENSIEGGVRPTLDCLIKHCQSVYIVRELALAIDLHLLARDADLSKIKTVRAHEQALAQARQWLQTNLPQAACAVAASNAAAAKAAAEDAAVAAVGGRRAASVYGLQIVREDIHDREGNMTRFFVIGREQSKDAGDHKTSLLLATPHQPGALAAVLKPLADHAVNMTHLESRPLANSKWRYLFFLDLEGKASEPNIKAALKELKRICNYLVVLGSYPKASL